MMKRAVTRAVTLARDFQYGCPDCREKSSCMIRLVFAVAVTVTAVVETVLVVRNIVAASPVFQEDWEGVKTMA